MNYIHFVLESQPSSVRGKKTQDTLAMVKETEKRQKVEATQQSGSAWSPHHSPQAHGSDHNTGQVNSQSSSYFWVLV